MSNKLIIKLNPMNQIPPIQAKRTIKSEIFSPTQQPPIYLSRTKSLKKKYNYLHLLSKAKEIAESDKKIDLVYRPFPLLAILTNKFAINKSNSLIENLMNDKLSGKREFVNNSNTFRRTKINSDKNISRCKNDFLTIDDSKSHTVNKSYAHFFSNSIDSNTSSVLMFMKSEKVNSTHRKINISPEENYARYAYKINKMAEKEKQMRDIRDHLKKINKKEEIFNKKSAPSRNGNSLNTRDHETLTVNPHYKSCFVTNYYFSQQ